MEEQKVYQGSQSQAASQTRAQKQVSSDITAIILAGILALMVLGLAGLFGQDFRAIKYETWEGLGDLVSKTLAPDKSSSFLITGLVLTGIFSLGQVLRGKDLGSFIPAFIGLFVLANLVYILSAQARARDYLEYAFWALLLGLVASNLLGLNRYLSSALKSGSYVKLGLVLMGAEVIFSNIASFGAYGIAISWLVVPLVIVFMWYFGIHYLKMTSPTMVMVLAVTTSVCGVSAAVAAAASINAKKEDLTFSVGISIVFTIVMMVLMPVFAKWAGIPDLIGGAWIGNTVDSTGAVVLAGEALGPLASQVAAMVKMIQNVLIGLVAFLIAIFFAKREGGQDQASLRDIWDKMPKFIFGFLGMSLVFSFLVQPRLGVEVTNSLISNLGTWKGWCFCLAFLSIGLETNFKDMKDQLEGGKPVTLYVVGQSFSLILSLLVCWIVLGGAFFPPPNLGV